MNKQEIKYKFTAELLVDNPRTGDKKGKIFKPKGFYYHKKNIILVGSVHLDNTVRISFPVTDILINIERIPTIIYGVPQKGD